MHTCLNVDEILRIIAHELVASRGGATAVALACCRKSFEDPVLDALWETQDGLFPLLRAFPGDVWNDDTCTSFKRLPTAIEWDRFRVYARRMRELKEFSAPRPEDLPLEALSVLRHSTINEPLLPNLNNLHLWGVHPLFIPFLHLFLSLRVTSIFLEFGSDCPKPIIASLVLSFPKLCPNLQMISLYSLPRDPMITVAVSGMILAVNRDKLETFHAGSPLTREASEAVYKLPSLRDLSVVIERKTPQPSASLPNLTKLVIKCDNKGDWPGLFHGATLGKLESVTLYPHSVYIGDLLGTFERVALSSSLQNTLSEFCASAECSWNPNYLSLLPFTQLVKLQIEFSCDNGCPPTPDDDILINLSRAMPKLRSLELGDIPCGEPTTGVTAKGLTALALHCPDLWHLRIHIQVASLSAPPANLGVVPDTYTGPAASRKDCALTDLTVGEKTVPEESASMVALTLLRIFPRISYISFVNDEDGWEEVEDAIEEHRLLQNHTRDG